MKMMSQKNTLGKTGRSNPSRLHRRRFIQATGAAALSAGVWSEVAAEESNSANNKLKILCVGTANRAAADIEGIESQDIVGLCDVDKNYLDRAAEKFKGAKTYADYREMIANEADTADAIVIATADHNHAPAAIRAINAGLHCYCEKPLTHTVREATIDRRSGQAAKGVATQMGTQIHAESNYRRVVEIVQAGNDRRHPRSSCVGRQRLGRRRSPRGWRRRRRPR